MRYKNLFEGPWNEESGYSLIIEFDMSPEGQLSLDLSLLPFFFSRNYLSENREKWCLHECLKVMNLLFASSFAVASNS